MMLTNVRHSTLLHAASRLWYDRNMPRPVAPGFPGSPLPAPQQPVLSEQRTVLLNQLPNRSSHDLFVGRESEFTTLQTALAQVLTNRGQFVLLSGEPGIGKTRLAQEFAAAAQQQGVIAFWGRCWEGDGAPAFWPWVQIVRALAQQCDADILAAEMGSGAATIAQVVPEVRERLPHVPATAGLESDSARFRFFDSLTSWFKKAAVRQPLLLILDDLHWADTSSLLLLQFLAREAADARLFVLGTYRDTEVNQSHPLSLALGTLARDSHRISLSGLAEAEVAHLVAGIGLEPQEAFVTALHRETVGNPFFLSEVLHLLVHDEEPTSAPFPIPHGVRETIRRRFAQASPACVELLTRAAVIGREFTLDLLCQSKGVQTEAERLRLLTWLQEALTARLLTEVADKMYGYRFVHALVRETLYEDLPLPERTRLHRHVGEAIEILYAGYLKPHLAELADHFFKATAGGTSEKALHYAIQAGERANALLAYEDAVVFYERALRLLLLRPEADAQRCEILLGLGSVQAKAGEAKKSRTTFLQAADIAQRLQRQRTHDQAATLLARAAMGVAGRGDVATRFDQIMVDLLESALAALPQEGSTLRVRLLSRLAMALYFSPFVDRRDVLSREAVAIARRLEDPITLAHALSARHMALIGPDTVTERLALANEVIQLAETNDKKEIAAIGHLWRLMDVLELGDSAEVDREVRRYGQLAEEIRQPIYLWQAAVLHAMQALLEGRFEQGEQLVQEAFLLGQRAQTPNALLLLAVQLATLRREQGRLHELEDALRLQAERYPAMPSLWVGVAVVHLELGRTAEAQKELERLAANEFADLPRDQGWFSSLALLSLVASAVGDTHSATLLYDRLLPYARSVIVVGSATDCYGSMSRYLGLLATTLSRWDAAEHHFTVAIETNTRLRARPFVAHTQYEYACMLLTRGVQRDQMPAQELLAQALATARELGMTRLEGKIQGLGAKGRGPGKENHNPRSLLPPSQLLAERNSSAPSSDSQSPAPSPQPLAPNTLRCEGDYWTVGYEGMVARLQGAKGVLHLVTLLREPHREFHVFDLLAMTDGVPANDLRAGQYEAQVPQLRSSSESSDTHPLPDRQARIVYQQRLRDLREELGEAERFNDPARVSKLRNEIDFLTHELTAAYGTESHARKRNEDVEKVRKTVTHRIRTALLKIKKAHPPLWRHLFAALKTGTFCSYSPEKLTKWEV